MYKLGLPLLAALFPLGLCAQSVVWDQGLFSGSGISSLYENQTSTQNFADQVSFSVNTDIVGYNYYTTAGYELSTASDAFHLKVLSDAAGLPGTVLFSLDLGYSSTVGLGDFRSYYFEFAPITLTAGTQYWIGLSGNGFNARQPGVLELPGGDSVMARFSGSSYDYLTAPEQGDQAFQLMGYAREVPPTQPPGVSAVPEPSTYGLLGAGALMVLGVARRRSRKAT